MADSAFSKIERASKHIDELKDLFRQKRPFAYVVETNTATGERATFAKKNEPTIQEAADIAADIVHNLRTALDHAFWEIVSPFATTEKERRAIQFPFSETAARLDEAIKNRLAHRVSDKFFGSLIALKPHGEPRGNELLYLIHKLDGLDKHRFPIPTGDYTHLSSDMIRSQVPDFPAGIIDCGFAMNRRDVGWNLPRGSRIDRASLGRLVPPTTCIFERELNVPVDIIFSVGSYGEHRPVIPTLHKLVDVTREAIDIIRKAV